MKEIPLKHGVALIDDEDYERLKDWRWYSSSRGRTVYAAGRNEFGGRGRQQKERFMHRVILGLTDRKVLVDHINHDGLDNRKENLRLCTTEENSHNRRKRIKSSSRFKGVYPRGGRWQVAIRANGLYQYLGTYGSEEEAAEAYLAAATKLHGEFVCVKS